jgi:hypothetical protein
MFATHPSNPFPAMPGLVVGVAVGFDSDPRSDLDAERRGPARL